MEVGKYLSKQPKLSIVILGFTFILFLGTLSHIIGPEIGFTIFYLMPILLVTWNAGKTWGVWASVLCILVESVVKLNFGHAHLNVSYFVWDELIRLGFFMVFAHFLSQREKSEHALLASEARYRALTYSANDAIVSANSAGNIVGWNRSAERLFGYTEAEAVGQSLTLIIPPRYRAQHLEGISRMQAGRERHVIGRSVELEGLRKDGSEFSLELSLSEWEVSEGRFFTAIIRDITDRKHLEKIALQSEKLSAVGQLAAGVAHEINNPLGVILGFAQGCVKRLQPNDPLELPMKSIEREANRCKLLVQELLTFSRANQNERREEDINKVIEKALTLVEVNAKMSSVELIREFEENLPQVVLNSSQMQQVIVNLCNNAIDAMPKGGTIRLHTRTVQESEKKFVKIQVQDTGPGISKNIQLKVFEPFFTTKEVGEGTGLGLSITHEIVQKHGGTIVLDSKAGTGTTFTIRIPLT